MCSSGVGTGKSQIGGAFTLAGVALSLLLSLRGSRLDQSSARATFKRNNLFHAGRKMLVWIKARMEQRAFVFKKKKRKEKKVRVPGVIFEGLVPKLWQGAWMGGQRIATDLLSVRQVTKVDPNQTSTPFTAPTQESNSSSSSYFFSSLF